MSGIDILPLSEAKEWVKVDYDDEDLIIQRLVEVSYDLIADSIDNFDSKLKNERFKRKLKYCMSCSLTDIYDDRAATTDKKEQLKLINQNALLQLKYCNYE